VAAFKCTRSHLRGAASLPNVCHDQGQDELLENTIAHGRCRTCGTPWASVVKIDGKRPVKVEGGSPNELCLLGDW
jgi:hypothetical protein